MMTLVEEKVVDGLHDIRCPACHRKLMSIRLVKVEKPIVELLAQKKDIQYTLKQGAPNARYMWA